MFSRSMTKAKIVSNVYLIEKLGYNHTELNEHSYIDFIEKMALVTPLLR